MRRSVIIATCALFAVALIFPSAAIAKGGNGLRSEAAPQSVEKGKSAAAEPRASKATVARASVKATKPNVATPQNGTNPKDAKKSPNRTTAKSAEGLASEAPIAEAAPRAEKPAPAAHEQPVGTAPPAGSMAVSLPSTSLAEVGASPETLAAGDTETRGVLDAIRVTANTSIKGAFAAATRMWSMLTSWWGN